jgi:mRNA interferase YafQ
LIFVSTNQFKKDLKRMIKRGKNPQKIKKVIDLLLERKTLPPKYNNHKLSGDWSGRLECHIEPNWLLIYIIKKNSLVVERTGSHSDLFT